jgi:hypothetical protein
MLRLARDGVSAREIGRTLGVARSTIQDNLNRSFIFVTRHLTLLLALSEMASAQRDVRSQGSLGSGNKQSAGKNAEFASVKLDDGLPPSHLAHPE